VRPAAVSLVVAAVTACSPRAQPPVGARVGPALAAALAAADRTHAPWRCAAPDGPAAQDELLAIGGRTWRMAAGVLTLDGAGDVAIAVIADGAGSAPVTLAAIGRLRDRWGPVDLVLSLGGMGATEAELAAMLATVAEHTTSPLVALPGDLEPVPAQTGAIAAVRQRGAAVLDGRLVRRIEVPGATLALVPGVAAASRLAAGSDGCSYQPADVTAACAELAKRAGLRVLVSAEAPRRDTGDEPTGELALPCRPPAPLDLTLHGPPGDTASPARTGGRDGARVALTPGSSDATPRAPGPPRSPSAGVLTIHGTAWSWRPLRDLRPEQ